MQTPHLQDVSMDEMQHISLGSDRRINIEDPAGPQTLLAEINDLRATCHLLKERLTSVEKRTAEDRTLFFRSLGIIIIMWVLSVLLFFVMRTKSVESFSPSPSLPSAVGTNPSIPTANPTTTANATTTGNGNPNRLDQLELQAKSLAWRAGPTHQELITHQPTFFFSEAEIVELSEAVLGSLYPRLKKFKTAKLVASTDDKVRLQWNMEVLAENASDLLIVTRCGTKITGLYMSYTFVALNRNIISKGNGFLFDLNHAKIYPELPKITTSDYFRRHMKVMFRHDGSRPELNALIDTGYEDYKITGRVNPRISSLGGWNMAVGSHNYLLEVGNVVPNDDAYRAIFISKLTSKSSAGFGLDKGFFPLETMEVDDYQVYQLLP